MSTLLTLDLSVLYGGSASGFRAAANPIQALRMADRDPAKQIAAEARKPEVQRDLATFRKAVANAKDVKSLLSNPTVQKVLLTSNGLADQVGYPALASKALTSKLDDPKSVANVLPNTRWKAAAATYDFAAKGLTVLRDPAVMETVVNAYAEISWRKSLDAATPGLSDALTFREKASSIKNAYDILGDPVMRRVVTETLGIPKQIAFQTLNAQENAITAKVDPKKFQDKNYVEAFVRRYLITAAGSASQPAGRSFGLVL